MVHTEITLGKEEKNILIDISLKNKYNEQTRKSVFPVFCLTAVIYLASSIYLWHIKQYAVFSIMLVVFLLFSLVLIGRGRWVQRLIMKHEMRKAPQTRYVYDFEDKGIRVFKSKKKYLNKWEAFHDYGVIDHYLYIIGNDYSTVLVDLSRLNQKDKEELMTLVQNIKKQ